MSTLPLFPASIIGSMPRPAFVQELLQQASEYSKEEYRRLLGSSIRYVVALQEAAGLDIISDGEWWRKSYIGVIAELAHGFQLSQNPVDGRPWTIVVDKLSPKNPGFIAQEVSFLKQLTGHALKATLPAPALLGERMWDPELSSQAYPTRESFIEDCVPILREEIKRLRDEGVTIIQIDDPHLCLFVDPQVRAQYDDPDQATDFAVAMNNQLVEGIEGVKLAVHLCRRAGARARGEAQFEGGYETILPALKRLAVQHITMEFTSPGAGEMSVLAELPEHIELGLGCVSCQPGEVDTPETIVDRVEQALRYIAPERITLNPDCGFAPGSAAQVSIDEVYLKLKAEVTAAQVLRDKYA